MSETTTQLRLRKDGQAVVSDFTSHLDPDDTKALRASLRDALLAQGVDLDDEREVARYVLEVRGHAGWFDYRGVK